MLSSACRSWAYDPKKDKDATETAFDDYTDWDLVCDNNPSDDQGKLQKFLNREVLSAAISHARY